MAKESKQQEPFEQLYARLEQHVAKLEEGGLPLEQAITLYEEGMAIARECQERLDEAELKITRLRETFAPVERTNGMRLQDEPADYEYVSGDGEPEEVPELDEDPFP